MTKALKKQVSDYDLSPEQLRAIIPIIHEKMASRMSEKSFNEKCLAALDEAGCPLAENA